MSIRLTKEEFVKKAICEHGGKYDYSLVNYTTTKTKIKIICKEHGTFIQTPNNHLIRRGTIVHDRTV